MTPPASVYVQASHCDIQGNLAETNRKIATMAVIQHRYGKY